MQNFSNLKNNELLKKINIAPKSKVFKNSQGLIEMMKYLNKNLGNQEIQQLIKSQNSDKFRAGR